MERRVQPPASCVLRARVLEHSSAKYLCCRRLCLCFCLCFCFWPSVLLRCAVLCCAASSKRRILRAPLIEIAISIPSPLLSSPLLATHSHSMRASSLFNSNLLLVAIPFVSVRSQDMMNREKKAQLPAMQVCNLLYYSCSLVYPYSYSYSYSALQSAVALLLLSCPLDRSRSRRRRRRRSIRI